MNLTIQNSEADQLLEEIYSLLKEPRKLELSDREKLEQRLKKVIDLRWEDSNLFESYFMELNMVLGAMANMDFSKRMTENDDPNSFLNLISVSFNQINNRLEDSFVGMDIVPDLMNSIKVENRIVLISSDKEKINRVFSSIDDFDLDTKELTHRPINSIVSDKVLSFLLAENGTSYEFTGDLSSTVFPLLENRRAHFNLQNGKQLIVTITLYPDNVIEENKGRILRLIRGLNEHFKTHPQAIKSISGLAYSIELNSLANELLTHIDKKFPPKSKPIE